jgi:hypothetical protein
MRLKKPRKTSVLTLLTDQNVIGPTRARVEGVTDGSVRSVRSIRSVRTRLSDSVIFAFDLGS